MYVEPVIVNAQAALASTVRTQGAEGLEEAAGPTTLFRVNGPGMIATGQSGTFEGVPRRATRDGNRVGPE